MNSMEGFKIFQNLPKQTLQAYTVKQKKMAPRPDSSDEESDSETHPKKISKKILLMGGDVGMSKEQKVCPKKYCKEYLEVCADKVYNPRTQLEFFLYPPELTLEFGQASKIFMKLGICPDNSVFKIYMLKMNPRKKGDMEEPKASLVGVLMTEIGEIAAFAKEALAKIEQAKAENKVVYKSEDEAKDKPQFLSYWQHPDCFYTSSGNCRLRFQWTIGNVYMCYINNPVSGTKWEKYHGPKIRLSQQDLGKMVQLMEYIVSECQRSIQPESPKTPDPEDSE